MYVTSQAWDGRSDGLDRFEIATETKVWTPPLSCFDPPVVSSGWILMEDKCTASAPTPAQLISQADGTVKDFAADQLGIVDRGGGYFTNYGGGVYQEPWYVTAQDLATKNVLWQKTSSSTIDVTVPVLAAGATLYVQPNHSMGAWDKTTGDVRWSRTPNEHVAPFAAPQHPVPVRWQIGHRHGGRIEGASDA